MNTLGYTHTPSVQITVSGDTTATLAANSLIITSTDSIVTLDDGATSVDLSPATTRSVDGNRFNTTVDLQAYVEFLAIGGSLVRTGEVINVTKDGTDITVTGVSGILTGPTLEAIVDVDGLGLVDSIRIVQNDTDVLLKGLNVPNVRVGGVRVSRGTASLLALLNECFTGTGDVVQGDVEISDVTGLQNALDAKADLGHTHNVSDITGLQTAIDTAVAASAAGEDNVNADWNETDPTEDSFIENKPTLDFAATSHTHVKADITDFDDADYADASHTHVKADITDFDDADYAAASHGHSIGEVTGLQAALDAATAAGSGEANVQSDWNESNSSSDAFILNKPTLFDGDYNSLTNQPSLFDGAYGSLSGLPTLFDGAYASLSGLPTLFDGDYDSLSNKPSLFDGAYGSLTGVPATFAPSTHTHTTADITDITATPTTGEYLKWNGTSWVTDAPAGSGGGEANVQVDWNESDASDDAFILNKPTLFSGDYDDLTNKPTIPTAFSGVYADLTGKPTLFDGQYGNLTGLPTLFDGNYNSLSNLPTLFDGAYGSLTGTPTIPTNNNELTNGEGFITDYTVTEADVTDHEAALSVAYSQLTSVPTTFTPSAHTHTHDDITDFDTEVNALITAAGSGSGEDNVQVDWDETDAASDAFILNKPTAVADLTNHLVTVSLGSAFLNGGGSAMDFDFTSQTQVLNMTQDVSTGTAITFGSDKFTVSEDGLYTVTAAGQFTSVAIARAMPALYIAVNGTVQAGADSGYLRNSGDATDDSASLTRTFDLTAGDEVTLVMENIGSHSGTAVRARTLVFEMFSHTMTVIGIDGTIGDDNVQADWNQTDTNADSFILNKPTITSFSGDYDDLTNKPTLFSEDYDDLTNKPTLVTSANGLSDVDTTTSAPSTGDVLEWDGSNWVPATPSGGSPTYTFNVSVGRRWSSNWDRWHTGDPSNGFAGDISTQVWTDFNPELFDSSTPYYYALNGHFIPTACTTVRVIGMVWTSDSDLVDEDLDIGLFRMTAYTDNGSSATGDNFHTESTTFPSSNKMRLFDTGDISQTFVSGDTVHVFWKAPNSTQTSGLCDFQTSYTVIVS